MQTVDYRFLERRSRKRKLLDRTTCGHHTPKLHSFGYYLLSLMCAAVVSLSAAPLDTSAGSRESVSSSIDAIGIASLQKSSDVALATSPGVQSSSIDAIGIASLQKSSDVAPATSPGVQSSSIDAIGIASLQKSSDVAPATSPGVQFTPIDAIGIASLQKSSDVALATSPAVPSSSIDAISIASLQKSSDVAPATSPGVQFTPIDAIGIASLQKSSDVAPATSPAVHPVDATALNAEWQALIDQIHAVERVASPFVESRTFAFRKEPKLYRGVFRKEIDGRVSLAYTEPEAIALHIGEGFAYYRKDAGTIRRIPESNAQGGALALFPKLLNFDLAALSQSYDVSGLIEGEVWQLSFVAQDESNEDLPYESMLVEGRGTAVLRIELTKNRKQRIVIEMGDPVYPEFYLPQIKAQYFFRPDSEE